MDRFREMEESRRGAGRGEGRGDLAADVARFTKAADDELALAAEDQAHRLLERSIETVRERIERPRLVVEDFASELQHVIGHAAALAAVSGSVKLDGNAPRGLGPSRRGDEWPRS